MTHPPIAQQAWTRLRLGRQSSLVFALTKLAATSKRNASRIGSEDAESWQDTQVLDGSRFTGYCNGELQVSVNMAVMDGGMEPEEEFFETFNRGMARLKVSGNLLEFGDYPLDPTDPVSIHNAFLHLIKTDLKQLSRINIARVELAGERMNIMFDDLTECKNVVLSLGKVSSLEIAFLLLAELLMPLERWEEDRDTASLSPPLEHRPQLQPNAPSFLA